MQTPEEFAREWLGCHVEIVESGLGAAGTRFCGEHHYPWLHDVDLCPRQERASDFIRARDAEVRAERRNFRSVPEGMVWQDYYSPDEVTQIREQALAEELAGFTEERKDICGNCGRSPCYARCRQREPNPQRRLVGPWEPVETAVLLNPPTEGEADDRR